MSWHQRRAWLTLVQQQQQDQQQQQQQQQLYECQPVSDAPAQADHQPQQDETALPSAPGSCLEQAPKPGQLQSRPTSGQMQSEGSRLQAWGPGQLEAGQAGGPEQYPAGPGLHPVSGQGQPRQTGLLGSGPGLPPASGSGQLQSGQSEPQPCGSGQSRAEQLQAALQASGPGRAALGLGRAASGQLAELLGLDPSRAGQLAKLLRARQLKAGRLPREVMQQGGRLNALQAAEEQGTTQASMHMHPLQLQQQVQQQLQQPHESAPGTGSSWPLSRMPQPGHVAELHNSRGSQQALGSSSLSLHQDQLLSMAAGRDSASGDASGQHLVIFCFLSH